jgi:Cytochrome c oxidase subunit IV
MAEPEQQPHPQGHEAFHLPPPSIWPAVLAVGIAMLLTGLILNVLISIVGAVITVAAIALWVRDARREFAELPE